MFKAWICIIIMSGGYSGSYGQAVAPTVIGDIARKVDWQRIGQAAVAAAHRVNGDSPATYQCVEIYHTPE